MAKFNFKEHGKVALMTGAEIGVIGGAMIATKKFLDFNVLFKNKIEKDPKFAESFIIKHQGAVKLVGGALGASLVKNPWLKMVFIGVALEGFITEVRTLTTSKDGAAFFDAIGKGPIQTGQTELDRELLRLAQEANEMSGQSNPTNQYNTAVGYGQSNPTEQYNIAVGFKMPGVDSDFDISAVGAPVVMQSSAAA